MSEIRQIAALPYRPSGMSPGAVEVLLITSRDTRRWVLPKGNRIKGLSRHASAAREAEEEAGVRGAVCRTRLGIYRYRKRLRSGAAPMVNVDVFPLAVTEELENWLEAVERTRRWFTPVEAMAAVEEPGLAALLSGLDATLKRSKTKRPKVAPAKR